MRQLRTLTLAGLVTAAAGCASGGRPVTEQRAEQTLRRIPAWYLVDQADTTRLVGRATASSGELQTALDIATAEARADLLLQIEARATAMTTRFREQTGVAQQSVLLARFTAVSRVVAAETLRGARVQRREVQAEGGLFRAYVLLELPTGEAARQLLGRLRRDEMLTTDARAARAIEALSLAVQRYEARRARAGQPAATP